MLEKLVRILRFLLSLLKIPWSILLRLWSRVRIRRRYDKRITDTTRDGVKTMREYERDMELAEEGHILRGAIEGELQEKLDAALAEIARVREENAQLGRQLAQYQSVSYTPDHTAEDIKRLECALEQAEAKRREIEALYETRAAELKGAQVYLDQVDDVADSAVVDAVSHLNGQIFNVAALLSDPEDCSFGEPGDRMAADEARRRLEERALFLGGPQLLPEEDSGDSTLLALQATLVELLARLANSWNLSITESPSHIERLYMRIRAREPQSVAGRWRALCRAHIKDLVEDPNAQSIDLFKSLAEVVTDVLLAYGAGGTRERIFDVVTRGFESELRDVLDFALKFQRMAGERIISRDFQIFTARAGDAFNTASMEDDRAQQSLPHGTEAPSERVVLCPTRLGLKADRKMGGGKGGNSNTRTTVLMKCSVILAQTEGTDSMAQDREITASQYVAVNSEL